MWIPISRATSIVEVVHGHPLKGAMCWTPGRTPWWRWTGSLFQSTRSLSGRAWSSPSTSVRRPPRADEAPGGGGARGPTSVVGRSKSLEKPGRVEARRRAWKRWKRPFQRTPKRSSHRMTCAIRLQGSVSIRLHATRTLDRLSETVKTVESA